LLLLNFHAHRSFNDPSQYPVFPWIIQDYKSEALNLHKKSVFRDLSVPIAGISKDKLDQGLAKYYEIRNREAAMVNSAPE